MRIERVSRNTRSAALRYLSRAPYLNVFITHVMLHEPGWLERSEIVVALDGHDIAGVAYCGRQLAIASEAGALRAFAGLARHRRGERIIIGERETVREFWRLIRSWHAPPRLIRDRQFVMVVDRKSLRPYELRTSVRHATIEEAAAVADGSAEMVRHELSYDPRRGAPDFNDGVRHMIERKLWWVGLDGNNALAFICNVGPWCDRTVQLQGIWTPPPLRGRGLATASLAAICDRLLDHSPTVSLYVNDFNEPAIALYRRVGFRHAGDFQTILF